MYKIHRFTLSRFCSAVAAALTVMTCEDQYVMTSGHWLDAGTRTRDVITVAHSATQCLERCFSVVDDVSTASGSCVSVDYERSSGQCVLNYLGCVLELNARKIK